MQTVKVSLDWKHFTWSQNGEAHAIASFNTEIIQFIQFIQFLIQFAKAKLQQWLFTNFNKKDNEFSNKNDDSNQARTINACSLNKEIAL